MKSNECSLCGNVGQTQKHHTSYSPEKTIDVCVPCHIKLHNHEHGVGHTPWGITKRTISIKEEHEKWVKEKHINLSRFVQSKIDEEME